MKIVKSECWKLYPDIGVDTGVRNAIVELIDEDLRQMWQGREALPTRQPNGMPSDQDLLSGLWKELGVIGGPAKHKG